MKQRIQVFLTEEQVGAIDAQIGVQGRSRWIREAVEERLKNESTHLCVDEDGSDGPYANAD